MQSPELNCYDISVIFQCVMKLSRRMNRIIYIVNDIKNFVFGPAKAPVYGFGRRRKQKFVIRDFKRLKQGGTGMEIGKRNSYMINQYAAGYAVRPEDNRQGRNFDSVLETAEEKTAQKTAGDMAEPEGEIDYRKFLLEKMEEMRANIRNGTIQPKIQIGAEAYTQEEWEKLLEKIDAAEEAIREQVETEIAAAKEAAGEEEEDSQTRIITRADGTRILMIKTSFGEMSVELSKPDDSAAYTEMISETV